MITAPQIDNLLRYFERGHRNPYAPTEAEVTAMEPLFEMLKPLAPLPDNDEAKTIWTTVPRGSIEDYETYCGSFEDMKEWDEVETYEEYVEHWKEDYPEEICWYRIVIVECFEKDGSLRFRAVAVGNKTIISAEMEKRSEYSHTGEAAAELMPLLTTLAGESIEKLRDGVYNAEVNTSLPYKFRTGVIKREALWEAEPEWKENALEGLDEDTIRSFKSLLSSGANDENRIGRIQSFTANDFFRACEIGYKACGYEVGDLAPAELYLRYADGRDEGLTGTGHGLNEGPGIDFDDADAWNAWYFDRDRFGGHPWEIIRGGNSTHVDLCVRHDKNDIEWKYQTGKISERAFKERLENAGYYFSVAGKHRMEEAVKIYVALSEASLPVILSDSAELLARIEGTDYVGIVPHATIPKYCEGMFPSKYGRVIDFMHVYEEDMESYGDAIEWLPEDEAKLTGE